MQARNSDLRIYGFWYWKMSVATKSYPLYRVCYTGSYLLGKHLCISGWANESSNFLKNFYRTGFLSEYVNALQLLFQKQKTALHMKCLGRAGSY